MWIYDIYVIFMIYFYDIQLQRVILNGQSSFWLDINAGVPQGPFLIYFNNLPEDFVPVSKVFANDTFYDIKKSSDDLNRDLSTVNNWAFQWKIAFNPDPNKQATEVFFFLEKENLLPILP